MLSERRPQGLSTGRRRGPGAGSLSDLRPFGLEVPKKHKGDPADAVQGRLLHLPLSGKGVETRGLHRRWAASS